MGLFTRTKLGQGVTKTRNNKTGKTSYSQCSRSSGGKNNSRNLSTGKVTRRQSRKP